MAKKKPTTSAKPRSTGRSNNKNVDTALERVVETEVAALEKRDAAESAAEVAATADSEPRVVGAISDVEIGHVAGDVWGALARSGPLTVTALKKEVKAPGDLVAAAIGWLAREDKLEFANSGRTVKVGLRS